MHRILISSSSKRKGVAMHRLLLVLFLLAAVGLLASGSIGCSGKGTEVKTDPSKTTTARPSTGKGMDKIESKE